MPRDGGGFYTLPAGNPVVPGTVIESDWANPTMEDMKAEMSDSLSRAGKGGMLAALRGPDGSAAVPTFSFTNEPSTGRFRDGPGQIVEAVDGTPVVRYLASGLEQWDSNIMDWVPLTPRDALGTPFDPAPSNLTSTNVQDAIEEVNDKTGGALSADNVTYDDSNVYFAASTVQIALDAIGGDIPGLANDILDNADAIQLIDGDLTLLESRVTQNEINIGANTNNIDLNTIQIIANIDAINLNLAAIDALIAEQAVQNSDIALNATNIQNNYNITQTNAGNISTNANDIAINAAGIASNLSSINANTSDISFNAGLIDNNASNISANTSSISSNSGNISTNTSAIATNESRFPGGVLHVLYGGTGVTNQTGTGATVHIQDPQLNSPQIYGGDLLNGVLAETPTWPDKSGLVSTTEYVQIGFELLNMDNFDVGANANGEYIYWQVKQTGQIWLLQSGQYSPPANLGTLVFPLSFYNSNYYIATNVWQNNANPNGNDFCLQLKVKSRSSFTFSTPTQFTWLAIGRYS